MVISDVLGRQKEVTRVYEDGSYECPFCHNGVLFPKTACENPWCVANPICPVSAAEKIVADQDKRDEEERQREANNLAWALRFENERAARDKYVRQKTDEARNGGYCLTCLWSKGENPYYVRHRNGCPKER